MVEDLSPALFVIFTLAFFSWYIAFVMITTRPKINLKKADD